MQQYFVVQAHTYAEAERKARAEYGDHLTILMHETVKIPGGFLNIFSTEGVKLTGIIPLRDRNEPLYLPQSKVQMNAWPPKEHLDFAVEKEKVLAMAREAAFLKETVPKETASKDALPVKDQGKENELKEVLALVKNIGEKLDSATGLQEIHPTLKRIDDLLIMNDFSPSYRSAMLDKMRKEISLAGLNNFDAVQDKVLIWIGESLKIYENDRFKVRPRIMVLVGPTGVGKTTTIAKLAANFGINEKGRHKRNVVLVTIDAYRIGAKQQLEAYGVVMEFPCFSVSDYDELKKVIAVNTEGTDLFLIDTIGKSPRDMVQLGEMKQFLDACGALAEIHLVLAATTKSSDLTEILKNFEFFDYKSVIVTKVDETMRFGSIIGTLSEKAKAVSYVTTGQKVPTDIRKASVVQFLINLEGFKINRIKLEEKFPEKKQTDVHKWR